MINFDGTDLLNAHEVVEDLSHLEALLALGLQGFEARVYLVVSQRLAGVAQTQLVLRAEQALFTEAVEFLCLRVELGGGN